MTTVAVPQHIHSVDEFAAYEAGVLLNNRYMRLSNIQVGSYGQVSLARDVHNNVDVAVKAMNKQAHGVTAVARHELSVLKRLGHGHENVCQLLDFFETPTHYFIVFEYCANGDLYDYLKSHGNHLSSTSAVLFKQFVKELASAVKYAHSRGVFHRDIKPENVLITGNGSIKLTDWGLATVCAKCFDPCIGTEKYMAPETFFKKSSKPGSLISYDSAKADYWSFGITLLYTLFGHCPFKLANVSDPNFKKFVDSPQHLFTLYPNLSNHGFHAIMQLLQLNPIHRSLDKCLEVLTEDYAAGLTLDQEMNQFVNFEPEEMVFGLDDFHQDSLIDNTSVEPIPIPSNLPPKETVSSSVPSSLAPPSLMESCPMGTSWADMDDIDDWGMESFKIQQIGSLNRSKDLGGMRQW
jgi:serine/threonine protein kinase